MEELKNWLDGFIAYNEKKLENIKKKIPDNRNIKIFEGEIIMAKKVVAKIDEISKK